MSTLIFNILKSEFSYQTQNFRLSKIFTILLLISEYSFPTNFLSYTSICHRISFIQSDMTHAKSDILEDPFIQNSESNSKRNIDSLPLSDFFFPPFQFSQSQTTHPRRDGSLCFSLALFQRRSNIPPGLKR